MADEYKRINLLIGTQVELAAGQEEGMPGIVSDSAYRLGVYAAGAWRLMALRGSSESFADVTLAGLSANAVPRANAGKTLVAGSIQDTGALVTSSSPIKGSVGISAWGISTPASRPEITGQRTATATLAALYQAISATGLILDSTTGSSVTREAIIQPLPITNAAPGAVTVVSGGMRSFGFDGGASTEELFYHCDVQHDYIAGGDMVFHVHWMPATATGGNVKWQIEYQWVEGGATWPAPTTLTGTDAAGATAWADKRTDITIPGAGRTYNSRLMVRLFRVPTDAADTYAGDAVLSSVGMHYQADPGQP